MTVMDPSIERFLASAKADGRSSPAGIHWQRFWEFLRSKKRPADVDPPVPLILAASGASDHSKHMRLAEQLEWAREVGTLDEAIVRLKATEPHCWNRGPLDQWGEDNYY